MNTFLLRGIHGVFLRLPCGGGSLFFNGEAIAFERPADAVLRAAQTCSPFPLIVIRVLGYVLPNDFFCEKAGRRTTAAVFLISLRFKRVQSGRGYHNDRRADGADDRPQDNQRGRHVARLRDRSRGRERGLLHGRCSGDPGCRHQD